MASRRVQRSLCRARGDGGKREKGGVVQLDAVTAVTAVKEGGMSEEHNHQRTLDTDHFAAQN